MKLLLTDIFSGTIFRSLIVAFLIFPASTYSQNPPPDEAASDVVVPEVAPVTVDGKMLFSVRGISSYPAAKRAEVISDRITSIAADESIDAESITLTPEADFIRIASGSQLIMHVLDADAQMELVDKEVLAKINSEKIKSSIRDYREARSRPVLLKKAMYAAGAIIIFAIVLFVSLQLIRRLNVILDRRLKARLSQVENLSYKLISSEQLWKAIGKLIQTIRILVIVVLTGVLLNYILSLFPWTNKIAVYVFKLFTDPILELGRSFYRFLPSLAFLIIIFVVTRYILKLIRLLFSGIAQGGIVIKDFDPEWAIPTFKIVRTIIIAFVIVIAYPYIPGSNTDAFKGISLFIGVLFSLGSSSFISNIIAGYSMTYRRAFRKGDRIKVDDIVGFVEDQKLLITRLRSVKNEEIIIPNSILLNSNIINYTARATNPGLILHTTVTINYDTPWRQVEAMLKLAAARTEGFLKEPPPFVLQKSLGEFAVTYEINGFCTDVSRMPVIYNLLHQNILDVFNENNVQIMVPAYEGDPEKPKIVPKDKWNTPLSDDK